MNLRRIQDAVDYEKTAKVLTNNFYVVLASKLQKILSRKKESSTRTQLESKILNNNIRVLRDRVSGKEQVMLFINGALAASELMANDTLVNLLLKTVTSEIEGKIKVYRPKGRKISNDRMELNPARLKKLEQKTNTELRFPSGVYQKMNVSTNTGEKFNAVKKGYQTKAILSETDYNYGIEEGVIKEENYEKIGTYYYNKTKTYEVPPVKGITNPLNNFTEFLARNENEEFVTKVLRGDKVQFVYRGNLFVYNGNTDELTQYE